MLVENVRVTMVKKRLLSGEACPKCSQTEELLRRRGLWDRIDDVVWAIEGDATSRGMKLAAQHEIQLAPFFIVEAPGAEPEVFVSALKLIKAHFGKATSRPGPVADVEPFIASLGDLDGPELVAAALKVFGADCGIAFSGAEDVVLIDMAAKSGESFSVFSLDTGRLHPETYAYLDRVAKHYGISPTIVSPERTSVEALTAAKGLFSFYEDGHGECCGVRKVEPLSRALKPLRAWMTGQRQDQSPATRSDVPTAVADVRAHATLAKLNPLARWTSAAVWAYIRDHNVPFNPLHSQGFRSIGCAPCTRAVHPGQHEREGRWWWEDATKRECGLHLGPKPGA